MSKYSVIRELLLCRCMYHFLYAPIMYTSELVPAESSYSYWKLYAKEELPARLDWELIRPRAQDALVLSKVMRTLKHQVVEGAY